MRLPKHVAIIMDGNGRWGQKNFGNRLIGHNYGIKNIEYIIKKFHKTKIKNLTLYSLSSDNLKKRKTVEIKNIFLLLKKCIIENKQKLKKKKINLRIIGEYKNLPTDIKKLIISTNKEFQIKKNSYNLNIAFNYSSKEELISAVKKNIKSKKIINISNINKNLYTYNSGDPEILIRTGGHTRLSNFLLWQCSYTEIFFIKKYWPDFKMIDLFKIISKYKKIRRNFGK